MKNERKRTFMLITIPILALFVCFNTIPLIRGVIYISQLHPFRSQSPNSTQLWAFRAPAAC